MCQDLGGLPLQRNSFLREIFLCSHWKKYVSFWICVISWFKKALCAWNRVLRASSCSWIKCFSLSAQQPSKGEETTQCDPMGWVWIAWHSQGHLHWLIFSLQRDNHFKNSPSKWLLCACPLTHACWESDTRSYNPKKITLPVPEQSDTSDKALQCQQLLGFIYVLVGSEKYHWGCVFFLCVCAERERRKACIK